ncbi:MAG: peptidylprolyl isomerase [Candidatus Marsarchaeota archaeon]|jgi:FKBP-type peptidyl-prolyl cis-trans isomerase 2|nr:peptidylprolyl isomerase [Candidatus Marsarchaeota archaeon]
MSFNDKDFLEIEYNMWDAVTNELIETTDKKKAEEGGIYNDKFRYGKSLVIVGSAGLLKGLDRELRGMSMNEKKEFVLEPEDAFGSIDEKLIRVMPLSEFRNRGVDPYPGMRIELDNGIATIRSVNSGRVVVDLNHIYAGRRIRYELEIVKNPANEEDKIKALCYAEDAEPSEIILKDKTLSLAYDNKIKKDVSYFSKRMVLVDLIFKYIGVEKINVEDKYKRESEKTEDTKNKD